MSEDNDSLLIQRCLAGDRRSFEAVVERYQRQLFNVALRIVGDHEDAEDVTQQTFVKAFENLRSYNKKYKFFSWLYRIAINESLNQRKSKNSRNEFRETEDLKNETDGEVYSKTELEQRIQCALGKLKNEYRVVIVLKHFQDLSYEEISSILDIPIKTVKSRLFSARQQLKEILIK